jgi:GntR family transcriptional regulator
MNSSSSPALSTRVVPLSGIELNKARIPASSPVAGGYSPKEGLCQLPNEDDLIEAYAVSRTTIRQTIQNLRRRGLVEIRRGKGTFVLQPKITQELTELSGFVEDMRSLGRQASARLLDKQIVPAG